MTNEFDYHFIIRRVEKSTEEDYVSALKIYNETTPPEIKTNTNEITKWLDCKTDSYSFEPMFFTLNYAKELAGFAMMTYVKSQRIAILEYVALATQYRVNTVFFAYVSLLENYLYVNRYDVVYILNEVSNRQNGTNIDKESQLFAKLLCSEGYGEINAPYITPPLGLNNYESSFDAFLFAKSSGDIHSLEKKTYLDIVHAMYYDYYLTWYEIILSSSELESYRENLDKCFTAITKKIDTQTIIPVSYMSCPLLQNSHCTSKTNGLPPAPAKKPKVVYPLIVVLLILCPIIIVWGYHWILSVLNVPVDSVNGIIGNCLGAIITASVTLFIAKKKL